MANILLKLEHTFNDGHGPCGTQTKSDGSNLTREVKTSKINWSREKKSGHRLTNYGSIKFVLTRKDKKNVAQSASEKKPFIKLVKI